MLSNNGSQHFTSQFWKYQNYKNDNFVGTSSKTNFKKGSVIMSQNNAVQQLVCLCPGCTNYRTALEESIQDEICDAGFYAQIANEAPTDELRELITSLFANHLIVLYRYARQQKTLRISEGSAFSNGGSSATRTPDALIKSQVLYLLS